MSKPVNFEAIMIARKVLFFFLSFLLPIFYVKCLAQVDTSWVARYNGPADSADFATAMAMDTSGYIYVTGGSRGIGTDFDYATIKYNPLSGLRLRRGRDRDRQERHHAARHEARDRQ